MAVRESSGDTVIESVAWEVCADPQGEARQRRGIWNSDSCAYFISYGKGAVWDTLDSDQDLFEILAVQDINPEQ